MTHHIDVSCVFLAPISNAAYCRIRNSSTRATPSRQAGTHASRQAARQAGRQAGRQRGWMAGREAYTDTHTYTDNHTHIQAYIQTYRDGQHRKHIAKTENRAGEKGRETKIHQTEIQQYRKSHIRK